MPVFKLEPVGEKTSDERWATSTLCETCWVNARSDIDARVAIEGATIRMVDVRPGEKILYSPWQDEGFVICLVDDTKDVPEGHFVTAKGRVLDL